jgi:stress-induced morphogen
MPIAYSSLLEKIHQAFPDASVTLTDLVGDSNHYAVEIASPAFEGKSRIAQHKLVHQALDCLGDELHALQIKTIARNTK